MFSGLTLFFANAVTRIKDENSYNNKIYRYIHRYGCVSYLPAKIFWPSQEVIVSIIILLAPFINVQLQLADIWSFPVITEYPSYKTITSHIFGEVISIFF